MAVATSVSLPWADGTYTFHLDIPRLKELQEKCSAGPAEVLARLSTGRARIEDVQESIRLGLIGGGTAPSEAIRLVERYVDARPLVEGIGVALLVVGAAVVGHDPEAAAGNGEAARTKSRRRRSTSRRSEPTPS